MRTAHVLAGLALLSLATLAGWTTHPTRSAGSNVMWQPEADPSGSSRAPRIAYPIPPGPASERPTLTMLTGALSQNEIESLRAVAPNVQLITGLTRQTAMEHAGEAHAVEGRLVSEALLKAAPSLVWVHSPSAGVERYIAMKELAESDRIVLTNSRAVHGPAIADHAMAMLLMQTRNLGFYAEQQAAHRWDGGEPARRSVALSGKTMLVVGLGGIGSEIAARAHGFDMRIIATRRTDGGGSDYVERVGRPADLLAMLPEADVVAICVPLTAETDQLFNAKAFAAMKPGAFLINIARGRIVETEAMLASLRSGRLAGACLDVTDPEPLPPDHPLWKEKNIIITPHVSNDAELTDERHRELFTENIRRFGAGEPLLNVVDKRAGY